MAKSRLTNAQIINNAMEKEFNLHGKFEFTPAEVSELLKKHFQVSLSPRRVSSELSRLSGISFRKMGRASKGNSSLWTSAPIWRKLEAETANEKSPNEAPSENAPGNVGEAAGDSHAVPNRPTPLDVAKKSEARNGIRNGGQMNSKELQELAETIRNLKDVPDEFSKALDHLRGINTLASLIDSQSRTNSITLKSLFNWSEEVSKALIEIKQGVKYLAEQSTIAVQPNSDWRDGYKEGMKDGEARIREQILKFIETGFKPDHAMMLVVGIEPKSLKG